MVLWLSTDFGDFPNFWWGVPLKSGVSQKRLRNLQLTILSMPIRTVHSSSQLFISNGDYKSIRVLNLILVFRSRISAIAWCCTKAVGEHTRIVFISIATLMAEACGNGRGVQMKAVCVSDQKSVLALRLLSPMDDDIAT